MVRCYLDIKTGKALPVTALQTIAYTLLDTPVDFIEDGHRYTLNGVPLKSVTGILKDEGFIDSRFFDEESRKRGSLVHLARHLDDMWELDMDTVDDTILPYLKAWRRFMKESGFVLEQSEVPMASNTLRYAGTPDVIGHFPTGNLARGAVELRDDGKYKLIPYTNKSDINIWLAALAINHWKSNHGRG